MLKEYAVDPAIVGDFSNLRQIANLFDFSNPRRISRFPKRWERMVYEAAAPLGDMNAKRVEEKLKQFKGSKSCLCGFGRDYDSAKNWVDNALESNSAKPFSAIICESDANNCVKMDDLEDTHTLLAAQNSQQITKSLRNYKNLFNGIFVSVKNICIVDPYFSTYENKSKKLYAHWFKLLNDRPDAASVNLFIISSADRHGGPYSLGQESTLISQAQQVYANNQALKFNIRAKLVPHNDDMHDRFIITDIAAFSISSSLIIDTSTMMVHMITKADADGLFLRFDQ